MSKFYVKQEQADVPVTVGGVALPTGSAWMVGGVYIVNGVSYDCTRQGLYRWWNPAGNFINRIVIATGSALDVYALMSAVCYNHVHGTATETSDYQVMSNSGRYVKWSARCGYISGLMAWLMPQLGWQARIRNPTTVGPKNGFDDGHIVVETLHDSEWRMWDLSNACYFRDANGKHLSTTDLIVALANNGSLPEMVPLTAEEKRFQGITGNLDFELYRQWTLDTPAKKESWYRRIFQSIV